MKPKAFISYSWTSEAHQQFVIGCAERLVSDGIDVILDVYDLKEGHDKYRFMEKMVTDPAVTHVLVFSDHVYAKKADDRKAGVGTETQIISREVYAKTEQSKFIPLVCEFAEDKTPCLPTFFQSRVWLDFSTPEAINSNWEKLIRLLFGKPMHIKPKIGKPPIYITSDETFPATAERAKFDSLRQAILQEKKGLQLYRKDFLDSCIQHADSTRVRIAPNPENFASQIVSDAGNLSTIRDYITDWILLESSALPSTQFTEAVLEFLESLREIRSRPKEVTSWNDAWFDAHRIFSYETFLYIVAALIKTSNHVTLHEVFWGEYILPDSESYGNRVTCRFDSFYAYSEIINSVLASEGRKYYSPAAELLRRQAQRSDLPFDDIIQADLLALLISFIDPNVRWYPQTLLYSQRSRGFPLFLKASRHKYFKNLAIITGIENATELREAVRKGQERMNVGGWNQFMFRDSFWEALNMEKLDTAP